MTKYLTRKSNGVKVFQDGKPGTPAYRGERYTVGKQHKDNGNDAWKLDVGAECNLALEQAEKMKVEYPLTIKSIFKRHFARHDAIVALVERVANFEELETE